MSGRLAQVGTVALDPWRGYASALACDLGLPPAGGTPWLCGQG
jgi:hypothetical protein